MKSSGLQFKKVDLHVHTPASDCFQDKAVTPEQFVQKCIEVGLSAIAVTDHNTGAWIDRIKTSAKGKNLTVFPGVEITVGDAHNHIVAILDIDKTTRDIEDLLKTGLGLLHDQLGKKETFVQKSVVEVIETITGSKFNGIAVLAHIDSTNGVFDQMKGVERKSVVQHPKLLAVEAVNFAEVAKLLNGTDPVYQKKLTVYQASDNPCLDKSGKVMPNGSFAGKHCLNGIGFKFTYFKVDDRITLESLRQCFIDSEVRVRQSFEYKERVCPYIKSIKINSGFLADTESIYHHGLNSILGAKGTGKSLLIEFMRFALDQESLNADIQSDHNEKISEKLGQYGQIEIIIHDETAKEFQIVRTYNTAEGNPIECKDLTTGDIVDANVAQLFPALFLSQTEIIKIAQSPEEQMNFIDKFFDFHHYRNQILNVETELEELDKKFADSLKSFHEEKNLSTQLQTAKVEMERLTKQLQNPIFNEFTKLESKDKALRVSYAYLKRLVEHIDDFVIIVKEEGAPEISEELAADPALQRTRDLLNNSKNALLDAFATQRDKLSDVLNKALEEYKVWKISLDDKKKKYQEEVLKLGGDAQKLEEKRKIKAKEIEDIEKKLLIVRTKSKRIKEISELRNKKLDELKVIYVNYFLARKERCEYFEKLSSNRLQIKIIESTNRDEFKRNLAELKRGTYLREPEVEQLCQKISPDEFILNLLRYDVSRVDDESDKSVKYIEEIAQKTGLPLDKVKNLADHLLNTKSYDELLLLQYKAYPQDRPDIRYNIGDDQKDNFVPLNNLSTGQKCTAMLILALSDGIMPIVIDQPEDSLDLRGIWDDMCCKIRSGKDLRQFIFTTHNSSVAVASDTDKFIILGASATKGDVVFSGAIDNEDVRQEVIKYLEGGIPTYKLKYLKYNIPKKLEMEN